MSQRLIAKRTLCVVTVSALFVSSAVPAGEPPATAPTHGRAYRIAGLPQHDYTLDAEYEHGSLEQLECAGTVGFIIRPNGEIDAKRRWIWISNLFLAARYGQRSDVAHRYYVEQALSRGFHVVGVDVGTSCGSPAGAEIYAAFHRRMIDDFRLNARARMIGQSNAGLITYGFAFRNPDKVERVLGIFPATDLRSWPGLNRLAGRFVPEGLSYGLDRAALEHRLSEFNPIDNLRLLAEAGVKIYHIHGTSDEIVPLEPNTGEFAERYRRLGGDIQIEVIENGTHGAPKAAFFESRHAVDFLLQ